MRAGGGQNNNNNKARGLFLTLIWSASPQSVSAKDSKRILNTLNNGPFRDSAVPEDKI